MALNSSGPISLAGSTAGQSIALELSQSATGTISLNDTAVRNLAGVPSGAITMPTNFWGKSSLAGYFGVYHGPTPLTSGNRAVTKIMHFLDSSDNLFVSMGWQNLNGWRYAQISSNFTLNTTSYYLTSNFGSTYGYGGSALNLARNVTTNPGTSAQQTFGPSGNPIFGWFTNLTYSSIASMSNTGMWSKVLLGRPHPNPNAPYTSGNIYGALYANPTGAGINSAGTQAAAVGYFYNTVTVYPSKGPPVENVANPRWYINTWDSAFNFNSVYCTTSSGNSNGTLFTSGYSIYAPVFDSSGNIFTSIAYSPNYWYGGGNIAGTIVKFDSSLNVQWQVNTPYDPFLYREVWNVGTDSSGNFYYARLNGTQSYILVVKLSASTGSVVWQKRYNYSAPYSYNSQYAWMNNDCLFIISEPVSSSPYTYITRVDISTGDILWTRSANIQAIELNFAAGPSMACNGTNYVIAGNDNYPYNSQGAPYMGQAVVLRMPVSGAIGTGTSTGTYPLTYASSSVITATTTSFSHTSGSLSFASLNSTWGATTSYSTGPSVSTSTLTEMSKGVL
jgi:hypothetical protein